MTKRDARAVLFDLDNTLTDRPASIARFTAQFRERYATDLTPISEDDLFKAITLADRDGYRGRLEVCSDLATCLPWKESPPPNELQKFWLTAFPSSTAPAKGIPAILDSLEAKGLNLAIVSNGGTFVQNTKIDVLGLRTYMKAIVISEEVGVEKPGQEIFSHALRLVGVRPSEALFVGDDPYRDIEGARLTGVLPVWLRHGRIWPKEKQTPPIQIDSLTELLTLL
jgi:putative hydrolase of the HAD superfamily